MIIVIIAAVFVVTALILMTKPKQVSGMCPKGGPRWKNVIGYLLIRSNWKKAGHTMDPDVMNRRVPVPAAVPAKNYNDSFVFQGCDEKGTLFMTRIGFRDGGRSAEVWLWVIVEGKIYANTIKSAVCDAGDQSNIEAAGVKYHCEDRELGVWTIEYGGNLEPGNLRCSVQLRYEPESQMYHSGLHMDAGTFARAMAEMPWNREFFTNLQSESQTRIEQGGTLTGLVEIDGTAHSLSLIGVRDHSWGKRNWNFINRYIWNVLSFTEPLSINGCEYNYICYTTVDYGTTFKCLVSGWIAGRGSLLPIIAASDQRQIGGDGVIPEHIECLFQPKGSPPLPLTIERSGGEYSWYMGNNEFEVCEAYCTFSVNGRKGIGMSEFGYSKKAGYASRF